jgi:hypothetical protein
MKAKVRKWRCITTGEENVVLGRVSFSDQNSLRIKARNVQFQVGTVA